jgi:magnesium transporter
VETIDSHGTYWTDILGPSSDEISELERYHFHRLNLDDCLSKVQIPKIDKYRDYIFIILHFPVYEKQDKKNNNNNDIPRSSQLAIFAGINFLVTVHNEDLDIISEIFELCKSNDKEREVLIGNSPGFLLHHIIDALVDGFMRSIIRVENRLDELEEFIFNSGKKHAEAQIINLLKREVTILRRIALPLRSTVLKLTTDIQRFSKNDLTPYYNDINDHIEKIVETLEEAKETIEIYKDVYFMHGTERSNKILGILTIIFTLSIPVTVISSFYGMNIMIPGRIEVPPTFLGPYTTMILVIIASIVPSLLMYWYFRHAGWMSF